MHVMLLERIIDEILVTRKRIVFFFCVCLFFFFLPRQMQRPDTYDQIIKLWGGIGKLEGEATRAGRIRANAGT